MTEEQKKSRNKNLGKQILEVLDGAELTPDEIADQIGVDVKNIRPRITEMKKKGLIKTTGEKREGTGIRKPNVLTKAK